MSGEWSREGIDEALNRATDYGRTFFDRLFVEVPELRHQLVFLRFRDPILGVDDNVYAIFDRPTIGFGIQIDTLTRVIVIWTETDQGEHADWGGKGIDSVANALQHIRTCLARSG